MRPGDPAGLLSVPKRGAKAWVTTSGETMLTSNCRLYLAGPQVKQWPITTIPALFNQANQIAVAYHGSTF